MAKKVKNSVTSLLLSNLQKPNFPFEFEKADEGSMIYLLDRYNMLFAFNLSKEETKNNVRSICMNRNEEI